MRADSVCKTNTPPLPTRHAQRCCPHDILLLSPLPPPLPQPPTFPSPPQRFGGSGGSKTTAAVAKAAAGYEAQKEGAGAAWEAREVMPRPERAKGREGGWGGGSRWGDSGVKRMGSGCGGFERGSREEEEAAKEETEGERGVGEAVGDAGEKSEGVARWEGGL